MRTIVFLSMLIGFGILAPSDAAAKIEALLEKGAWQSHTSAEKSGKVCYMASFPTKSEGKYKRRGDAMAVVAHRPKINQVHTVSLVMGYPIQKDSTVTVTIGKAVFKMAPSGSTAWATGADDKKITKAMRAGNTMIVRGTSTKGTKTRDVYSLKGFTAVHNAINKACKVK